MSQDHAIILLCSIITVNALFMTGYLLWVKMRLQKSITADLAHKENSSPSVN